MQTRVSEKLCETCGSSLDLEAPSGFCPACLLTTALDIHDAEASVAAASIRDYEIVSEIARGGMGIVYRARQRVPTRIVALKMILPDRIGSSTAVARFRAEAEAAASLDHENILPIYAVGESDGVPFYSMKFAEGGNLAARLGDYLNAPRESAALVAALARAVGHAHERGILHRDLKPGNVLFDAAGKPFVSDFGLAKWLEREADLTQTLAILGTPYYMAPEQAAGSHSLTAATDVYSLGAILFHLLTGQPPFRGDNAMEVLRNAAEHPAQRPRTLNSHIPADLETICLKCLEKNPAARYASAVELADDLDRFLARRAIFARRTDPITRALRWMRRNPVITALLAALAALLVSLLLVLLPAPEKVDTGKSIAVLPFENLSDDPANAYFASGIQDDVIVNLSKIGELKVIARDSVLPYKDGPRDVRGIGKALGVNAVLQGSVRRAGTRARINVQLVDTATGREIWADNFDREITDVFAIQSDLALQVASALKATLSPLETAGIQRQPTRNAQAYLLYVQANDLFAGYMKARADLEKAEQLFEKAISLDPKFALALAQLSQLETIFCDMYDPAPARLEKARATAQEALRLQPDLPEAHMAMGRYYWQGQGHNGEMDFAGALREFQTAERGLPGSAEIQSVIARVERQQGKWIESLSGLEKAAALDPNMADRWHRVFYSNVALRRYAAAAKALDRAVALSPNTWLYEVHRAWLQVWWKGDVTALARLRAPAGTGDDQYTDWIGVKMFLGRYDEAEKIVRDDLREEIPWGGLSAPKSLLWGEIYRARQDVAKAREYFEAALPAIERAVEEAPLDANRHMVLANVYAGLGRKEEAIREGKRACELLPESKDAWLGVWMADRKAELYMKVGEPELALPLLEHSVSVPAGKHVQLLRVDPQWEPLRSNPRFQKLLANPVSL